MLKFRQSSIISKEPGYLPGKLKICWAPAATEFNIFYWNFAHISYLTMSTKVCLDFFYFV